MSPLRHKPRRIPVASVAVMTVLLLALLTAGVLTGRQDAASSPRAPGLRGSVLPQGMTRTPAPPFGLRGAGGEALDTRPAPRSTTRSAQ